MLKISEEGIGRLITKEEMKKDKVLPHNQCCMVFLKPEISHLDRKFFGMVTDTNLNDTTYTSFFNKEMDNQNKRIIEVYHPHKEDILYCKIDSSGSCKYIYNGI